MLGTSRRTLSRSLAAEGATFTNILDAVRSRLAKEYVEEGTMSAAQIAYLLGYNEQSSFTRAFQRWTGTTPTKLIRPKSRADGSSRRRKSHTR